MTQFDISKDINSFLAACTPEKRRAGFRAQVTSVAVKETKTGKTYHEAEFADASGTVKMKCWDNGPSAGWCAAVAEMMGRQSQCPTPNAQRPTSNEGAASPVVCVEVTGAFSKGDFGVESNDWVVRALSDAERAEFFLGSAEVRAKQARDWRDITEIVDSMQDRHFRVLCQAFLRDRGPEFRRAAAARGNHHARPGGLVEHVAGMMRAALSLASCYDLTLSGHDPSLGTEGMIPMVVNRDLLIAGVLLHDCGKLVENQYVEDSFEMPFTARAELLGHIAIGCGLVAWHWNQCEKGEREEIACDGLKVPPAAARAFRPWPKDKLLHLRHLILSHHGTLEWGSPVVPKTYEATLLHFVDNIDAKMEMMRGAREKEREIAPGVVGKAWPIGVTVVTPKWDVTGE